MLTACEDTLFSRTPVARKSANTPLLVVGLPRSGSSFLSEVISQFDGWYVFDDLYLHRRALEIGATGVLSEAQMDRLLFFLGWQIRARLRFGSYAIPNVAEDEIEAMNAALKASLLERGATWAELQEEWMYRLARRAGCEKWGYKMPQAFRHLDALFEHYPEMRVIFLLRAPKDVLASYKHMRPDSQDGNAAQYHPIAHAVYWRLAARAYFDAKERFGKRIMLLKFEDLTADPTAAATKIAAFLDTPAPGEIRLPPKPNTSYRKGGKRRGLNGLELFFLERIAGDMRKRLGFERGQRRLAPGDIVDLAKTTLVFTGFRVRKFLSARLERFRTR